MKRIFFFLLFPVFFNSSAQDNGTDITVTSSFPYTVSASTTLTRSNVFMNGGDLTLEENAHLILTNDITFQPSSGSIHLQQGAKLTVNNVNMNQFNGVISTGNGCIINVNNIFASAGSSIILSSNTSLIGAGDMSFNFVNLTAAPGCLVKFNNANLDGNSLLNFNQSTFEIVNQVSLISGTLTLTNAAQSKVAGSFYVKPAGKLNFTGDSKLYLKGNWHNEHALNSDFNASGSQTILVLEGQNQNLYSNTRQTFYKLICEGNYQKSVYNDLDITHTLDLKVSDLYFEGGSLTILNPEVNAVLYTSGYVRSSEWSGNFFRHTHAIADYFFPIASKNSSGQFIYRPVIIRPNTTASGKYGAKVAYSTVPSPWIGNVGASLITQPATPPPYSLNNKFYHIIERTHGPAADISIFYDQNADTEFNTIAQFSDATQKWEDIGGVIQGTTVSGLTSLKKTSLNDFANNKFLLGNGFATVPSNTYAVLKKRMDGGFYLTRGKTLYFKFDEEYSVPSGANLSYKVFDKQRQEHTLQQSGVEYGDNRYGLDVSSLSADEYYILEVHNSKNEIWLLRFKVNE